MRTMDQTVSLYRPRRLTFPSSLPVGALLHHQNLPSSILYESTAFLPKTFHECVPDFPPFLRNFPSPVLHASTASLGSYIIACPSRAEHPPALPPPRCTCAFPPLSQKSLVHVPLSHQPFSWKFPSH